MITWVIESSVSSKGDPLPDVLDQPIRPPKQRTMNSKMGRDVSSDKKKVYGAKRFATCDCGLDVIIWRVGRLTASSGFDAEGFKTNSSSCSSVSTLCKRASLSDSSETPDAASALIVCRTALPETLLLLCPTALCGCMEGTLSLVLPSRVNAPIPAPESCLFRSKGGGYTRPMSVYNLKQTNPSSV